MGQEEEGGVSGSTGGTAGAGTKYAFRSREQLGEATFQGGEQALCPSHAEQSSPLACAAAVHMTGCPPTAGCAAAAPASHPGSSPPQCA